MCDFCELEESGFSIEEFSGDVDLGKLGNLTVLCGLENEVHEPNRYHLGVWVGLDTHPEAEPEDTSGILQERIICKRINYCPLCGRKLVDNGV